MGGKVTAFYGKGNKISHSILWVKTFLSLIPPLHLLLMVYPNIFLWTTIQEQRPVFFCLFVCLEKIICFPRKVLRPYTPWIKISLSIITWALSISRDLGQVLLFEKENSDSSQEEIFPSQILDSLMKASNIRPLINQIPFS